ncbi:alginate export family protein [Pleomorphovibrio marinus]|uniref:alginate export family protein n=1 Tax=Pleomorphovibrio marinus TaxID=2164132 RepID=UPI000E09FF5B|nr:alginate export family protein [Pleomorphovibrio marinus]
MARLSIIWIGILTFLSIQDLYAQFSVDGQIIQRSEFRNGFNRMIPEDHNPASFIAHRARLQARYEFENLTLYMSVQDVRTWGSAPQVKATDAYLSLHEAWAETKIGEYWSVKLGRQELNYDNFRFLGNLDWALQARSHDFALVKYERDNAKLHLGGGYNQDAQFLSGNVFLTPNQYKTAQMARYENLFGNLEFSALFWNDGRQFVVRDGTGTITEERLFHRQTLGIPMLRYKHGQNSLQFYYYHQFGKDPIGRNVNAFNVSLNYSHVIPFDAEKGSALTLLGGAEILSGTDNNQVGTSNSYNPLYGTNHLFNGYMDLFYVGGTHENTVGLQDYYLKSRYAFNKKLFLQGDVHAFFSAAEVWSAPEGTGGERMSSFFGTELDLSLGYVYTSAISLQAGYSQLFHSDTFAYIQGISAPKNTQNWAYLMLIFRPTMKNKFIGILL